MVVAGAGGFLGESGQAGHTGSGAGVGRDVGGTYAVRQAYLVGAALVRCGVLLEADRYRGGRGDYRLASIYAALEARAALWRGLCGSDGDTISAPQCSYGRRVFLPPPHDTRSAVVPGAPPDAPGQPLYDVWAVTRAGVGRACTGRGHVAARAIAAR